MVDIQKYEGFSPSSFTLFNSVHMSTLKKKKSKKKKEKKIGAQKAQRLKVLFSDLISY